MLAKVQNGSIVKYPYSEGEMRRDNPDVSFPRRELTDAELAQYDAVRVYNTPRPDCDYWTQSVDEFPPAYIESNQRWEQSWAVRDATQQEVLDRRNAAISEYQSLTQQRLDDFARTRNYDGILSACTYATSPTAKFAQEGQYCVQQRDATWAALYQIMAEVDAGTRPIPADWAEIEALLPVLEWPAN